MTELVGGYTSLRHEMTWKWIRKICIWPGISFDDTPHLARFETPFIASYRMRVCRCQGEVVVDGGEYPMTNAFVLINGVVRYLLIFQIGAIIPTVDLLRLLEFSFLLPLIRWKCVCVFVFVLANHHTFAGGRTGSVFIHHFHLFIIISFCFSLLVWNYYFLDAHLNKARVRGASVEWNVVNISSEFS